MNWHWMELSVCEVFQTICFRYFISELGNVITLRWTSMYLNYVQTLWNMWCVNAEPCTILVVRCWWFEILRGFDLCLISCNLVGSVTKTMYRTVYQCSGVICLFFWCLPLCPWPPWRPTKQMFKIAWASNLRTIRQPRDTKPNKKHFNKLDS
jgi:hypothetical protein